MYSIYNTSIVPISEIQNINNERSYHVFIWLGGLFSFTKWYLSRIQYLNIIRHSKILYTF